MTKELTVDEIWTILEEIKDPEIPVISVIDLGVVREVIHLKEDKWNIKITPTYTGCPATQFMAIGIESRLKREGLEAKVDIVLSPAWTTDWITEKGRKELKDYGITPPQEGGDGSTLFGKGPDVPCPRCNSINTHVVSQFGSTACKALYQCDDCQEPFDYFKCHK